MFLFLKNNDGGVFVTYLKRLKGSRLFDEWAADKEKERYAPSITVTSCNIIVPLLTGKIIITEITITEIQTSSLSIQTSNTFAFVVPALQHFFSNITLINSLYNKKRMKNGTETYYETTN